MNSGPTAKWTVKTKTKFKKPMAKLIGTANQHNEKNVEIDQNCPARKGSFREVNAVVRGGTDREGNIRHSDTQARRAGRRGEPRYPPGLGLSTNSDLERSF